MIVSTLKNKGIDVMLFRNGLGSEVIVVNKDAVCTCRCGKSFKI
jgi:CDGSH-type Zn-finger protein